MTEPITVTNKRDLKAALKNKAPEIMIDNMELVKQIRRVKKLPAPLVITTIAALGASLLGPIGLVPATASSLMAIAFTGADVVLIVAIVSAVGAVLAIVLVKDYDVIEFEIAGIVKFKLVRKAKNPDNPLSEGARNELC